jgi:hypothetical protein
VRLVGFDDDEVRVVWRGFQIIVFSAPRNPAAPDDIKSGSWLCPIQFPACVEQSAGVMAAVSRPLTHRRTQRLMHSAQSDQHALSRGPLGYFHQRVLEVHGPQTPVLAMGDFDTHSGPGSEPKSLLRGKAHFCGI